MKKLLLIIISLFFIQGAGFSKDILQFDFPNEGWHKVESPDGIKTKKCYVPLNQTGENYNEMLTFTERVLKNTGLSPAVMMQKQLGKDRNNYKDIVPQFILRDENDTMVAWCSQLRNTCVVQRAFKGNEGVIFAIYTNKAPHYSQNIFGQWSNILATVKVHDKTKQEKTDNLIELD